MTDKKKREPQYGRPDVPVIRGVPCLADGVEMPIPFFVEKIKVAIDDPRPQIGIITRVIAWVDFLNIIITGMFPHTIFLVEKIKVAINDSRPQIGIITRVIAWIDFLDIIIARMFLLWIFVVPERGQQKSIKNKQQKQNVIVFIFQ